MGNKTNVGYLKLNKTTYIAGENVFGEFCLKLIQDIYAESILIKVRGVEQVSWEEMSENGMRSYTGGQTLISHDLLLYRIPYNNLSKGDYIFQFVIELPKDIPSSTSISLLRLQGKITYTIEAVVVGTDLSSVSTIKVVNMSSVKPTASDVLTPIKGILWIDRGEIYLRARCESGYSYDDDKLRVVIDVDRSKSHWPVGAVDVSVVQTVSVKSNDGRRHLRKTGVYSRHFPVQRDNFAVDISLEALANGVAGGFSSYSGFLEVGYTIVINGHMDSIFSCYGEQPQLSLWFSMIPKDKAVEVPKYNFAWKPKVIEIASRNTIPIYS
jgi:hypothetical protein